MPSRDEIIQNGGSAGMDERERVDADGPVAETPSDVLEQVRRVAPDDPIRSGLTRAQELAYGMQH